MDTQKTFKLTLGKVTNTGGEACVNPVAEYVGSANLLVECIDTARGVYTVSGDIGDVKCLTFILSCKNCGSCPREEVTKCLCTGDGECGACESCIGNVCVTNCKGAEFCASDNTCVECDTETPCPPGFVCKNRRCVCPTTAPYLVDGKCLECLGTEVKDCQRCVNGEFQPIPCSGACDPTTNTCVGCLQGSDCDGPNECCIGKECQCCPGFVRDPSTGLCKVKPECTQDSDCGACESCNYGGCDPVLCPDGKVCVGEGGCVDACSCSLPIPCPQATDTCKNNGTDCGCVPCTGTCATGCGTGCYCDGTRCVGNPCAGGKCPCTNGSNCPPGFGCLNGQCVPCVTLDCTTLECGTALGCGCSGDDCVGIPVIPCTTQANCPPGTTCVGGFCVPCSAFPCSECNNLPGCECNGAVCVDDNEECSDTFTLTKNNEECTLTARLAKTSACACSPLTADVVTRRVSIGDDNSWTLEFKAEARKGAYMGDLSNPLLDNLTDPRVVENDSPTAGEVTITSYAYYLVFTINPTTGERSRTSSGVETQSISASYLAGNTASLVVGRLTVPKPGQLEIVQYDLADNPIEEWEYTYVRIESRVTDAFDFPNTCTYPYLGIVGEWRLTALTDINAYGATFGNHRGVSLTTTDTRLPIFRWYKSATPTITGLPFRKLYVDLASGAHSDTLTIANGLEACKYYKVASDCSCAPSPDVYGVFCTPADLVYVVDQCNRRITLGADVPPVCAVNMTTTYYMRAGSVYVTWRGDQWSTVAGNSYLSNIFIETVEYGQLCDAANTCKQVYAVDPEFGGDTGLAITITPQCNSNATAAEVFIPTANTTGVCNVTEVVINGTTYFPGTTATFAPGSYSATITWACGCAPTVQNFTISCCQVTIPPITRTCAGVGVCTHLAGAVYTVNGDVIPDICAYVAALPVTSGATISVKVGTCPVRTITIPPVSGDCCDDITAQVVRTSATTATLQVFNAPASITVLVSAGSNTNVIPNITPGVTGQYTLSGLEAGSTYAITIISATGCPNVTAVIADFDDPTGCTLDTDLQIVSTGGTCGLRTVTNNELCPCDEGQYYVELVNVANTDTTYMTVSLDAGVQGLTSPVLNGISVLTDVGTGLPNTGAITGPRTVIVQKQFTTVSTLVPVDSFWGRIVQNDQRITLTANYAPVQTQPLVQSITIQAPGAAPVTKSAPDLLFTFTNQQPSFNQVYIVTVMFTGANPSQTYNVVFDLSKPINPSVTRQFTLQSQSEVFATLRVLASGLEMEDGCRYNDVTTTFKIKSDGSVFNNAPTTTLPLIPTVVNARFKEFTWYRNGVEVLQEYEQSISNLPSALLIQGATYRVDVDCPPCSESRTEILCCPIIIDATPAPCANNLEVRIQTVPGSYTLDLDGDSETVVVPSSGVYVRLYEDIPEGTYDGYVEPLGLASCRVAFSATVVADAVAAISSPAPGQITIPATSVGGERAVISVTLTGTGGVETVFTPGTYAYPTGSPSYVTLFDDGCTQSGKAGVS